MNAGTRVDHDRFCTTEGWDLVRNARGGAVGHHVTYELAVPDGRVLRTRISRPVSKVTYGHGLWRAILRDQLNVTEDEFWSCVRDGRAPDRGGADDAAPVGSLPAQLVHQLISQLGLSEDDIARMGLPEAMTALQEHWSRPPD